MGKISAINRGSRDRKEHFSKAKDELTWTFIDPSGLITRRELAKHVVEDRGMWLVVMYLYQDLRPRTEEYDPPKIALVRYRKYKKTNRYEKVSSFNLSVPQVKMSVRKLREWAASAIGMAVQAGEASESLPAPVADYRTASALEEDQVPGS